MKCATQRSRIEKSKSTNSVVTFILQSLLRYGNHFHYDRVDALEKLIDGFLAHRDIYGFASYQPEHNQDVNHPTEQEIQQEIYGKAQYRDPDDTTEDLNKDIIKYKAPTPAPPPDIITKFKSTTDPATQNDNPAPNNTFIA